MGYPVAYRKPRRGGFQPAPREASPFSRPANDNQRPFRPQSAANDNFARPRTLPRGYASGLRIGLRVGARFLPYIGIAITLYEFYEWYREAQAEYVNWTGWTYHSTCSYPAKYTDLGFNGIGPNPTTLCSVTAIVSPILPGHNSAANMHSMHVPGAPRNPRTAPFERYTRDNPYPVSPNPEVVPASEPSYQPMPSAVPVPWVYPGIDPFSIPIDAPMPTPQPLPYEVIPSREINPERVPGERPEWGPLPAPRPRPGPGRLVPRPIRPRPGQTTPSPVPVVPVQPGTPPVVITVPGTQPSPMPSPLPGPQPVPVPGPVHQWRPPGPGEKERKVNINHGLAVGLNLITEAVDVVDALWWALPAHRRTRYATPQEKAWDVYTYIGELDIEQAIINLLVNEFGDRLIGGASRRITKGTRPYLGERPVGIQAGPAV